MATTFSQQNDFFLNWNHKQILLSLWQKSTKFGSHVSVRPSDRPSAPQGNHCDKLPVFQVIAGLTPSGFFATVISLLLEVNYKFINGTGALALADPIY